MWINDTKVSVYLLRFSNSYRIAMNTPQQRKHRNNNADDCTNYKASSSWRWVTCNADTAHACISHTTPSPSPRRETGL